MYLYLQNFLTWVKMFLRGYFLSAWKGGGGGGGIAPSVSMTRSSNALSVLTPSPPPTVYYACGSLLIVTILQANQFKGMLPCGPLCNHHCTFFCRHSRCAYGGESPLQCVNSSSSAVVRSNSAKGRAIYFWKDTFGTGVPEGSS